VKNNIIDILLKIYNAIGIIGIGISILLIISIFFIYRFIKKKLNPFVRAKRFYEKENLEKALLFLLEELDINPKNREALKLKADIELKLKLYREAERDYYSLIYMKRPGDGINSLEIKKTLLFPLYKEEKLLETFRLAKKILRIERTSGEALYFLALIYMGQLYYREAKRVLERLLLNRPYMHDAHFAYALVLAQLRNYDESLNYIKKAIEIDDKILYNLVHAGILYFMRGYQAPIDLLKSIGMYEKRFETKRQYYFSLRLFGFCNYMLGNYEIAIETFKKLNNLLLRGKKRDSGLIYNRAGSLKDSTKSKTNPILQEFWKLKELANEVGKGSLFKDTTLFSSPRLLDIEGLNTFSIRFLDLGFSMIRGGKLEESVDFFKSLKKSHPEIIGLNKLVKLIEERIDEKGNRDAEVISERVISRKNRKYELWEYIEKWERESLRPYDLIVISDFTAKKHLSPTIFFRRDGIFKLDF